MGILLLGAPQASALSGESNVNAGSSPLAFINHAKGFDLFSPIANFPSTLNDDGFPTAALTTGISSSEGVLDTNYFGRYLIWWTGTSAIQLGPPYIVYAGGTATPLQTATGTGVFHLGVGFNSLAGAQPTSTNPVEFSFGALITGRSNASGLVRFTTNTNYLSQVSSGINVKFNNLTGMGTGPNDNGSWTITKIDDQTFDVVGSNGASLPTINTSGTIGTNTEVIFSIGDPAFEMPGGFGFTISGWSDFVFCQKANKATILAGQLVSPDYVSTFTALNPRFIRVMDMCKVQSDRSTNFDYRTTPSNFSWNVGDKPYHIVPKYYGGTITNGGSDSYAVNNPATSPSTGAPVQGEVVVGQFASSISNNNAGWNPTLAINRAGFGSAKPILTKGGSPFNLFMSGPVPPSGTVITGVFSIGGVSSQNYTYTTSTSVAGPGGVLDTSFRNIAINIRADFQQGVFGSGGATALIAKGFFASNPSLGGVPLATDGTPTLGGISNGSGGAGTIMNVTQAPTRGQIKVGTWVGAGSTDTFVTALGTGTGGTGTYTVSKSQLIAPASNLLLFSADINASGIEFNYNPNINSSGVAAMGQGGTISFSDNAASHATYDVGRFYPACLPGGTYCAFTYDDRLGGWVTTQGDAFTFSGAMGVSCGPPLEFYADLCVRSGCGLWLNVGQLWSDDRITRTVAALKTAGVQELVVELSNEPWNPFLAEYPLANTMGCAYGFLIQNSIAMHTWVGLRSQQIATLAKAAWTGVGGSVSTIFPCIMSQIGGPASNGTLSENEKTQYDGQFLDASISNGALSTYQTCGYNATYRAYGGPGGGSTTTNRSVFPNRPVDPPNRLIGMAPYWTGGQFNTQNIGVGLYNATVDAGNNYTGNGGAVTAASYNGLLVAAYNYRYGTSGEKSAALDFLYSGGQSGTGDFYNAPLNGFMQYQYALASLKVGSGTTGEGYFRIGQACARYDAARLSAGEPLLGVAFYEGNFACDPNNALIASTVIAPSISALSGYSSGYTSSLPGATTNSGHLVPSTANDDAFNIYNLLVAFRNDSRMYDLELRFLSEATAAIKWNGSTSISRIAVPGQYGFNDGNIWAMMPGSVTGTKWKVYDAIAAFDA